jgi:hypothetical protein
MKKVRWWESDVLNTQRFVCPRSARVTITSQRSLRGEKESDSVGRDRHEVQLNVTTGFYRVNDLYGHDGEVLADNAGEERALSWASL